MEDTNFEFPKELITTRKMDWGEWFDVDPLPAGSKAVHRDHDPGWYDLYHPNGKKDTGGVHYKKLIKYCQP